MGFMRAALGERYVDVEEKDFIVDSDLLHIHELRAPYAYVRFSRLRLSVRLMLKAPIELITLLFEARGDLRSWVRALEGDLEWMALASSSHTFTIEQWCELCRHAPKQARSIVRKVCDNSNARSLTLAETKPQIRRLAESLSCFCGKVLTSKAAFAVHQFKKHRIKPAVCAYANSQNACLVCLMQYSSRHLLCNHFK